MAEEVGEALVWKALADPSRRRMLDLLRAEPCTTGQVAAAFAISRVAVMRHLAVLAAAGLVRSRKRGRERRHALNTVPLSGIADRWLAALPAGSAGRLPRPAGRPAEGAVAIEIAHDFKLRVSRRQVFRALTRDVAAWWGRPYLSARATGLQLDARLGGLFREQWGSRGGKLLATVTALEPDRLLQLSGPFHVGLLVGVAEFRLEDEPQGTRLRFTHRAIGDVAPEIAQALAGDWAELLDNRLRRRLEANQRAAP